MRSTRTRRPARVRSTRAPHPPASTGQPATPPSRAVLPLPLRRLNRKPHATQQQVVHDLIMFLSPYLLERLLHHIGGGGDRRAATCCHAACSGLACGPHSCSWHAPLACAL
jgi:hypothetical protein